MPKKINPKKKPPTPRREDPSGRVLVEDGDPGRVRPKRPPGPRSKQPDHAPPSKRRRSPASGFRG